MVHVELESARRKRRADIQKIVLQSVAAAGVMSVALLAPNVLGALGKMGLLPGKRQKDVIRSARLRLVAQELLIYEGNMLRLTAKGKSKLHVLEMRGYKIPTPRRWDGRWRVLVFDIPEKRKVLRDKIRITLVSAGFVRLQQSVWIYPYPCEELITILKAEFRIGKDLLYMIVDTIEHDDAFRIYFDLRKNKTH